MNTKKVVEPPKYPPKYSVVLFSETGMVCIGSDQHCIRYVKCHVTLLCFSGRSGRTAEESRGAQAADRPIGIHV